jgi:hypothetical protein
MPSYLPFILPDHCERLAIRSTQRNFLGQHIISTRKGQEVYHTIKYSFNKILSREYRILDDNFASVDGGVTSLYVINWGDPKLVATIDGKGYITLNNVHALTTNDNEGGNRVVLWKNIQDPDSYGDNSTTSAAVLTDTTKSWATNEWANHKLMDANGEEFDITSNTSNTITVTVGTPDAGAYNIYRYEEFTIDAMNSRVITVDASPVMGTDVGETFVMPVYECYYDDDSLKDLLQTDDPWNKEHNDNYGPYYAGTIAFMQKGTGAS